jgi:hypothetical protein
MGYVEIFRPDGTVTKLTGGQIVWEDKHFHCDACGTVQPVFGSEITSSDGLDLIQLCSDCKKYDKKAAK